MSVTVVIPTLNAGKSIKELLDKLNNQTIQPKEIVVVDSSSDDDTESIALSHGARVVRIERKDFNHGTTRDLIARQANADYVLFMTQDAIPGDNKLIEKLLKGFERRPRICISTARQIARSDARKTERLVREYNYPNSDSVHGINDIDTLGIKAFFVSNVCAMYKLDDYILLGGFEHDVSTNEDMFFAAKVLNSEREIAYCKDAVVIHSHNLTLKEQYKRNYIQGFEIEKHKELLGHCSLDSEGGKLFAAVIKQLLLKGEILDALYFILECAYKYFGSKAGRNAGRKR